jgi:flagellar basal body-associated protein FliL
MAKAYSWKAPARPSEVQAEEPPPPKESRGRPFFLYAGLTVVMAVVALALVLAVIKPLLLPSAASPRPWAGKPVTLGSLVVNVAETDGRRYLKATVELGVSSDEVVRQLEGRRPQLLDLAIAVLSSKPLDAVTSGEGREGIKRELAERIGGEIGRQNSVRVYFTEFVVQ